MGSTPEELNTEIAGTREALATDMDALQDRVSPQAILDRRKAAAKSRVVGLKSRVMGDSSSGDEASDGTGAVSAAQDRVEGNPLAAGAIAFLAGVLVSAALPATSAEKKVTQQALDVAKEHGQPLAEEAKSAGQEIAGNLKDSASQAVQEVKDSAQDSVSRVKDEGQSSADAVRSNAQQ
jgi:gas vesicle protein